MFPQNRLLIQIPFLYLATTRMNTMKGLVSNAATAWLPGIFIVMAWGGYSLPLSVIYYLASYLVFVSIYDGEKRLMRQKLSYRTDSSGIYETSVAGLPEAGEYTVRLEGDAIKESLSEGEEKLETELLVVTTRNPIELAELTANRDFLNRAAQLTGGHVAEISNLQSLVTRFGSPKETLTERENVTLWDKWPLLVLFLGFLTTEWILRRKSGLA